MSKRKFDESNERDVTENIFNDEFSDSEIEDDVEDEEEEEVGEDMDTKEKKFNFSEHISDSSEDSDEEDEKYYAEFNSQSSSDEYFTTKSGIRWYKKPVTKGKQKITKMTSSIIGEAVNAKTILEAWHLFFTPQMIDEIVQHTNTNLAKMFINYQNRYFIKPTTNTELLALIGLLYMSASLKSSRLHVQELWSNDGSGVEIFRSVMPAGRFQILLRALTFDDPETREERRKYDKLAPIRDMFENFVQNCHKSYSVGQYVQVDEKLEAYRGKCSFVQYVPRKQVKQGIKLFVMVDSQTYYISNIEVYVGDQPEGPYAVNNSPAAIVERMITPISGIPRNVTLDKSFTSYDLVTKLLNDHKLTVVGAVRKTDPALPPQFIKLYNRPQFSSIFGFQNNMTLVSYVPKKGKNTLLLSSFHHDSTIDSNSGELQQPEIVTFYNTSKTAIEAIQDMCSNYDVSRISRRWSLTLFFSLLNIAGINSQIMFSNNTGNEMKRRLYLKTLCMEMVKTWLKERAQIKNLPSDLSIKIRKLAGNPNCAVPTVHKPSTSIRDRCRVCPVKKNRKTRFNCITCQIPICLEHIIPKCMQCYEGEFNINAWMEAENETDPLSLGEYESY